MLSHPAWVCGLKQNRNLGGGRTSESHPAWVCGLKQMLTVDRNSLDCHTLRGCVD